MKDSVEQEIKPEVYLHNNVISSRYYCGQVFNFHKADVEDSDKFFSGQQHFSDGFVNFIDTVKQVRFELQTGQIGNHEAYDRLTQAEDDNGLPTVAYMDTNGIQMSGHIENIKLFFGNRHDASVTMHYDMQGQLDGADRRAVHSEVDGKHADNISALMEMLDVHAEAVKAYDHDSVIVSSTEALSAAFTKLGLPFNSESDFTKAAIDTMVMAINEETQPSGHIVNRKLVPGGSK